MKRLSAYTRIKYFSLALGIIFSISLSMVIRAELFVYQMKFQLANDVLPALKPHLRQDTIISAANNQLFIQATPEEYEKIQSLLASLDKKPSEYFVEVKILNRKLDQWEMQSNEIKVTNNEVSGKVSRYQVGNNRHGEKRFSLRLSEGYQGFVNTGEEFVQNQLVQHYDSFIPQGSVKKITSGFYIMLQQVAPENVRVNVSTQSANRQAPNSQVVDTASTSNAMVAPLDQWVLLATINVNDEQVNQRQYSSHGTTSDKRWYYLKIQNITQ